MTVKNVSLYICDGCALETIRPYENNKENFNNSPIITSSLNITFNSADGVSEDYKNLWLCDKCTLKLKEILKFSLML